MSTSKLFNACFFRNSSYRAYSAQAFAAAKSGQKLDHVILSKQDAKTSTLSNGLIVASVENYAPVTRLGVFVKAGARYEGGENVGITHCLRNSAGLSTKNLTVFGLTRNIEQMGGNLAATSSREHMVYTLDCIRDNFEKGLWYLAEVTSQHVFKPWELGDFASRMKVDLTLFKHQPQAVLMEALHQAAFVGGLSHSLYSPDFMIGKHNSEMLQSFVKDTFTTERAAVVGLGVDHDLFVEQVENLFHFENRRGSVDVGSSKYGGGEVRLEFPGPVSYAAVVAEGASLTNLKEMLCLALLQRILGVGPSVKYSDGLHSKLGSAGAKVTNEPFAVSSLNVSYSDSGLFGFVVAGQHSCMDKLLKSLVTEMRSSVKKVTDQDVMKAKHQLEATLNMAQENQANILHDMGIQTLVQGKLTNHDDLIKIMNGITTQDVANVAAKVMKTKPSMAVVGRLHYIPHLMDLL